MREGKAGAEVSGLGSEEVGADEHGKRGGAEPGRSVSEGAACIQHGDRFCPRRNETADPLLPTVRGESSERERSRARAGRADRSGGNLK